MELVDSLNYFESYTVLCFHFYSSKRFYGEVEIDLILKKVHYLIFAFIMMMINDK